MTRTTEELESLASFSDAPAPATGWVAGYWALPPYSGAYWVAPRFVGGRFVGGYWGGARFGFHKGFRAGFRR